jgi:hypothetical protein
VLETSDFHPGRSGRNLAIGVWALAAPGDWFETFPGAGRHWLPLFGPYNEHLAIDVGAAFLAIGVLLVLAAIWMERRLVQAAAIAYLVYQTPHTVYHLASDDPMSTGDEVLNGVLLGVATLTSGGLAAVRRSPHADHDRAAARRRRLSAAPAAAARVRGLRDRQGARRQGRRGPEAAGGAEGGGHRALRVVHGLRVPAGTRAPRARAQSRPPRYQASDAFSKTEKLVLDYAVAMSHTPAEVDDGLSARLGEHFDDAQLVELTNAIALENHRARFNVALGLDAQGYSEGAFCVVPDPRPPGRASHA